jgi:mannose-6-phosphate isomerase-like protein (cupin superfamily)
VPWHNQEQEEIYFIVEGTGEMCLGMKIAVETRPFISRTAYSTS